MSTTVAEQPLSGPQAYAYILKRSVSLGLDPNAVLAVASKEGAGGGIGDGGHAFGPFQLNNAGGVITGKFTNLSPDQINAWAWTQSGLDYALNGIAAVARGLTGATAIHAIVGDAQFGGTYGGFERPGNESAEISGALSNYGKVGPTSFAGPSGKSSGSGGGVGGAILSGVEQGILGPPSLVINAVGGAASHLPVVGGIIGGAQDATEGVAHFLGRLADPSFWLRVLQILGGAGLAGVGLVLLVRQIGLADPSSSSSSIPVPIPVEV